MCVLCTDIALEFKDHIVKNRERVKIHTKCRWRPDWVISCIGKVWIGSWNIRRKFMGGAFLIIIVCCVRSHWLETRSTDEGAYTYEDWTRRKMKSLHFPIIYNKSTVTWEILVSSCAHVILYALVQTFSWWWFFVIKIVMIVSWLLCSLHTTYTRHV